MKAWRCAAALGTLVLLAACGDDGGGGESGRQPVNGKTFTMAVPGDPGNLDPHFTSLSVTGQVDRFLYDSLLGFAPDGKTLPGLAEKWESTSTTATFTLRKGVTCADGTPLTAATVAKNISFVGDPKNSSTRIGLYVPAGAKATADEAAGTVTVTAPAPDAFLERNLGGLPIVCEKGLADRTKLKQASEGTGMYTVTEAVPDDHYTLTRRKEYAWGPGDFQADTVGLPDKVVIRVIPNETTTANLVLSGEVNVARFTGPDTARLQGDQFLKRDVLAPTGEIWFNQKAGLPTADLKVREALVQSLDLGQMQQVFTSGRGTAATGLVAPALTPCKGDNVAGNLPAFDAAAGKAALAGSAAAGKKLVVAWGATGNPGAQAAAELLQQQWQAAGVQVELKSVTTTQVGQIAAGQLAWDVAMFPIGVTLPSQLVPFLSGPTPPDGANFGSFDNKDYQAAVAEAQKLTGEAGCDKWNAAEKAVVSNLDLVPFANSNAPSIGNGAEFDLSEGDVDPSSIRMLG
ncbi:ABC transporter substrate-binding protein [Paractinoplanes brasiliensis]|uniref:Peptide/nickel transport system substrate-binding protein n=1 Tax=Paractinoplanes brasiliensis TaxID=52695 RepID=A0A4V3C6A7_9ACTN|nr:ABC transporter substrate-binding protein [Actinoplanes brasiliensis]TDO32968.1 peptide/nickel transport system substrate-binding protein [Actinoplanes brasiliensis]GID28686.1 peptide ABC transporter substrate-binding protein [Actinoplanes brasiliensis]